MLVCCELENKKLSQKQCGITSTSFLVRDRKNGIPEEPVAAILTTPARRIVPTAVANPAATTTRRQVELLAEATPARVIVTLASLEFRQQKKTQGK